MTNEEKMLDILASMQSGMLAMQSDLKSIDNRMTKLELKMETDLETRLDALAEGQQAILEQLVPCSRVDELENKVKFLEAVVRRMSEDVETLRKAQ